MHRHLNLKFVYPIYFTHQILPDKFTKSAQIQQIETNIMLMNVFDMFGSDMFSTNFATR